MINLFISRGLRKSSPLLKCYSRAKYNWLDQSLIDFKPVPFELPTTKYLIFYSGNGVRFLSKNKKVDINNFETIAFGNGTANEIENVFGKKPILTGNGIAEKFSAELLNFSPANNFTFILGNRSLRSISNYDDEWIHADERVVYSHTPKANLNLGHFEMVFLTSPMNAESFFDNGGTGDLYIAIGATTKATMSHCTSEKILVPKEPSEQSIANLLAELKI